MIKKTLLGVLAVILVAGAVFAVPTIWFKPWSIDHFYARVFLRFAIRHPMLLSQLRILEPLGLDFHSDDLDDVSPEFARREAAWADKQLEILRSYDTSGMDPDELLSHQVLEWFLVDGKQGNRFLFYDYPVNQLSGLQSTAPDFMINTHQINTPKDAANYVARVSKFDAFFDQTLESVRVREELGIVPPRFVVEHVLREMREFVEPPPAEHVLYTHFRDKLDELADLEVTRRERLLQQLEEQIEQTVYPAYRRLIAHFDELLPRTTSDDGVWKFPEGDAFYDWTLRHYTTTDLTADQVHEIGLREVMQLQAEMREILAAEGYDTVDLGATMQALNKKPRFLFPDTDEGRQQIIEQYIAIIREIEAGLDPAFHVRPQAAVTVERLPEFKQATAPGAYYNPPPMDGSKPGIFYINLRSVEEIPKFSMRTLAYHEAVPGHHFQIAIQQELTGVPFFRRILPFTAFAEGWALYAERLAAEQGFQDDPYDRLGYLTAQLFRAVRLVVDTGIHRKRWTRQQAIDYMLANTGMPETDVVAEIERYIVNPGQACAYMVGQLKILELRERARERMPGFDIREFHDVVLKNGSLPLTLLEQVVEQWIESREQARDSRGATSSGP